MPIQISFFQSPPGVLEIKSGDDYVRCLLFNSTLKKPETADNMEANGQRNHPVISECKRQLKEYFDGV